MSRRHESRHYILIQVGGGSASGVGAGSAPPPPPWTEAAMQPIIYIGVAALLMLCFFCSCAFCIFLDRLKRRDIREAVSGADKVRVPAHETSPPSSESEESDSESSDSSHRRRRHKSKHSKHIKSSKRHKSSRERSSLSHKASKGKKRSRSRKESSSSESESSEDDMEARRKLIKAQKESKSQENSEKVTAVTSAPSIKDSMHQIQSQSEHSLKTSSASPPTAAEPAPVSALDAFKNAEVEIRNLLPRLE